ncbi:MULTISPECIES: FHA domain-containing protein [unclassified Anaeromyxobacter]|uniref:FHA domain-containing protein n=2 Tax=Anaeromyxobacter TaxID=161492 RepID=UPI001F5A4F64|nr:MULTISPECIES: FHA domain-containing protein [unclassified Anaeromyxobacter]
MKTVRQVAIADHLWEALERMAEEMGSDREALVNQAVHVFMRLNGYVVPGSVAATTRPGAPPPAAGAPVLPRAERAVVAEQVLDTAARLEREMRAPPPVPAAVAAAPAASPAPSAAAAVASALVLVRDDGTEVPVAKDRFVIGRGRHCDLVVDSAKVSREHVAIVREGPGWLIEDLGSSNGTWFRRERIARRRIEDGDEYFVCAERLRCALR